MTKAEEHIARLRLTYRDLDRLIHGNVPTAEFEAGLANALHELIAVMLEERVHERAAASAAADHASDTTGPTTER